MKECKKCGSKLFVINEGVSHKAELQADGTLHIYKENWASEMESVFCQECGEEYSVEDFATMQI